MPGRDRRGPRGAGPGTGGRRGACFADRGFGFGAGSQAEQSTQALKERVAALERELEDMRSRIPGYAGKQG